MIKDMVINNKKWFHEELLSLLLSFKASNEREEIIKALSQSKKYKLSSNLTKQLSYTVLNHCFSIEKNLNYLMTPENYFWFEYNHDDRGPKKSSEIERIGSLIMVNPEQESHISIWVAWQNKDGTIYNSYAIMHWYSDDFVNLKTPKKDDSLSGQRLLDLIKVTIPKGLKDEFLIVNEIADKDPITQERYLRTTQKSVSGEHVFLLAILLFMNSKNYLETELNQGALIDNKNIKDQNKFHLNFFKNNLIFD